MSLRVWLPLTKDLRNQGLADVKVSIMRGNETWDNNGKLGKCFYANGVNTLQINNIIPQLYNVNGYSLCAWFYIESQNTVHSGAGIISGGNWNNQVLNLSVSDWSSDYYTRLRVSGTNWNNNYIYNFYKNTWYHAVVCSDGNKTYAYINGQLIGDTVAGFLPSSIEGNNIAIGGATYYSGMQFFGKINDVRIYDHCLSPMEVKQISQGLVLHYPLDNNGFGQENLVLNSDTFEVGSGASGITPSTTSDGLHQVIAASGNSNWHASWATSTATSLLENAFAEGDPFTISFTIKSENANKTNPPDIYVKSGMGYYSMQGSVGSNWSTVYYSGTWKDANSISFHLGFSGRTGTYLFKNWKVEKGLKATPWCPNSSDALATTMGMNDGIEYDCSGFGNNGTRFGALTWSSDTPKYSVNTEFAGNTSIYVQIPTITLDWSKVSFAAWGRWDAFNSWSRIFDFGNRANGADWDICLANHSTNANPGLGGRTGGGASWPDTRVTEVTLIAGQWYHFVETIEGATCKLYVNGELKKTITLTNSLTVTTMNRNYLGLSNWSSNGPLKGGISDFRLYTTVLSADDVKSLYQNSAYIDSSGNVYGAVHEEV